MINPDEMLFVGVKHSIVAFHKTTGKQLWTSQLASGLGDGFVSLLADEKHVYAHSQGKVFCLDLQSGRLLWENGLTGLGYGIASLAVVGNQTGISPIVRSIQQQAEQATQSPT